MHIHFSLEYYNKLCHYQNLFRKTSLPENRLMKRIIFTGDIVTLSNHLDITHIKLSKVIRFVHIDFGRRGIMQI